MKLRLDTQTLLDKSASLANALDQAVNAHWGARPEWREYLNDVEKLALDLDKLADGKLKNARDVKKCVARTESARSPADAKRLDVRELEVCLPNEPDRYVALRDHLEDVVDYEPVRISDELMGISALTSDPREARRVFLTHISFAKFRTKLYVFNQGGPYPSTSYVWKITTPLDLAADAAAYAHVTQQAPSFSSRTMIRSYFDQYTALGTHKAGLRAIYRFLAPHQAPSVGQNQRAIDECIIKYLLQSDVSPQMFFDARYLNGADGDRFAAFWDQLGAYLELDVGTNAHLRRHGDHDLAYISKIVSVPSMIREVGAQLHAIAGYEDAPIPCEDLVRHQFTPNHPWRLTAARFNPRYRIIRKVQERNLRKEHEDGHWVAALAKYNKIRNCKVRDLAVEAGYVCGILAAGGDDKKQIPLGLPGLPVSADERPHAPVFAAADEPLAASDHCSHRLGALAPSVYLLKQIPEHPGDSWLDGVISVVLHDAVFEKSDPFTHMADLVCLLRRKRTEAEDRETTALEDRETTVLDAYETFFLHLQYDGGTDRNHNYLRPKLALLAAKRVLGLRRMDGERCAPSASASLIHERAMSLLNLGIQHTSYARASMSEDLEAMVANLSSMKEVRLKAGFTHSKAQGAPKEEGAGAADEAEAGVKASADDAEQEVDEILAMRLRRGCVEYLIRWKPPDADDEATAEEWEPETWEPEEHLPHAKEMVDAFLEKRLSPEEWEERQQEQAHKASKAANGQSQKAEVEALKEKQQRLCEGWAASIEPAKALIKDRWQRLTLQGKHVECPDRAALEDVEELHRSLLELDPSYDRTLTLKSQLPKMPRLNRYFLDERHTLDSKYLISMRDCDGGCEFGCKGWTGVPNALKRELQCRPVLPMLDPQNPGHFLPYESAAQLPKTDECDLPSTHGLDSSEVKRRHEADRTKKLHPSKVRAVFFCDDCGRPRCIYSETLPSKSEIRMLDAYLETVSACCGDTLFPEHVQLDGPEEKLKAKFYNKENLNCRDDVELAYFNYGGLRGREEFEHVCARCGADPTESPLVAKETLAGATPAGKVALPLCKACFDADQKPVVVGRSDKVSEELGRKEEKRRIKAAAIKGKEGAASSGKPAKTSDEKSTVKAGGKAAAKRSMGSEESDSKKAKPSGSLHSFFAKTEKLKSQAGEASSSKHTVKEEPESGAGEAASGSKGMKVMDLSVDGVNSPDKNKAPPEEIVVRMPPATPKDLYEYHRCAELTTSTFAKTQRLGTMVSQHCHDILRRSVEADWRKEVAGTGTDASISDKVLVVSNVDSHDLILAEARHSAEQLAKSAWQGGADARAAELLSVNAKVHVRDDEGYVFAATVTSVDQDIEGDSPAEYIVAVNGIARRCKRSDLSTDGGATYGFKRLMNGAGYYDKLVCALGLVDAEGNSALERYILIDFGVLTHSHFSELLWLPATGDLFHLDTALGCGHDAVASRALIPFVRHSCLKWTDAPVLARPHAPAGIAEQRSTPHDESNVCAFTSAQLLSMTLQQLSRITAGLGALKSDVSVSQELADWLRKLVTKASVYKGWREAGAERLKQLANEFAAHEKRKHTALAALNEEAEEGGEDGAPAKVPKPAPAAHDSSDSGSSSPSDSEDDEMAEE